MSYDPKLKQAINDIEALCKKYDLGGFVSLVSKEAGEFRYILPDWIALKEEHRPEGIGLRLKLKGNSNDPADH